MSLPHRRRRAPVRQPPPSPAAPPARCTCGAVMKPPARLARDHLRMPRHQRLRERADALGGAEAEIERLRLRLARRHAQRVDGHADFAPGVPVDRDHRPPALLQHPDRVGVEIGIGGGIVDLALAAPQAPPPRRTAPKNPDRDRRKSVRAPPVPKSWAAEPRPVPRASSGRSACCRKSGGVNHTVNGAEFFIGASRTTARICSRSLASAAPTMTLPPAFSMRRDAADHADHAILVGAVARGWRSTPRAAARRPANQDEAGLIFRGKMLRRLPIRDRQVRR